MVLTLAYLHRPDRRVLVTAGLAVAVAGLGILLLEPVREVALRIVGRATPINALEDSSIRHQLDLWALGVAIAKDHPLLGTGPETFPLVFRPYLAWLLPPDEAAVLGRFRLESPHDEILGIAAEMGLPAVVAFLTFLGGSIRAGVRQWRAADALTRAAAIGSIAFAATHVTTNAFKTSDVSTSLVWFILLGARPSVTLSGGPSYGRGPQAADA